MLIATMGFEVKIVREENSRANILHYEGWRGRGEEKGAEQSDGIVRAFSIHR